MIPHIRFSKNEEKHKLYNLASKSDLKPRCLNSRYWESLFWGTSLRGETNLKLRLLKLCVSDDYYYKEFGLEIEYAATFRLS